MESGLHIGDHVTETERLILRAWKESDLQDFYGYASVEGVGEAAGWAHHGTLDNTKKALTEYISGDGTFAVVYKENGKVIGSLGIGRSHSAQGRIRKQDAKGH